MKFMDWIKGGSNATATAKATPRKEVGTLGGQRITAIHGTGTLQEPGLRTDCPSCKASLAEEGSNHPKVCIDTNEATGENEMSCPHCSHKLSLSDLRQPVAPPPVAAEPARSKEPHPPATPAGKDTLTLRVKDEQGARNLCDDQYFLLGVLMGDNSGEAKRFLAALQRGGTYGYEVRRDATTGECEVKMWIK